MEEKRWGGGMSPDDTGRVETFLRTHVGRRYCTGCLGSALEMTALEAFALAKRLASTAQAIQLGAGQCDVCNDIKAVVGARCRMDQNRNDTPPSR